MGVAYDKGRQVREAHETLVGEPGGERPLARSRRSSFNKALSTI